MSLFVAAAVAGAPAAIDRHDLIGSWRDLSLTWEIGGYDFHADGVTILSLARESFAELQTKLFT